MEHVINLKKGFGSIQFGTPVEDIVALLGEADEVESMENAFDEPTTVLHYFDGELTLFFEGDSPTLQCIDSSMDMVENHYCQEDVDDEAWGERRVSFGEANVDFFFDNGVLSSVVWGV